ncbi:MAG: hypothetical protein ACRD3O_22765 [Terriglobia bacterium]
MATVRGVETPDGVPEDELAMDVEKTIEFLLENQARLDARMEVSFVRSEARFAKAEKRLDRIERLITQLASAGLRFRNDIRRSQLETDRKLDALIDLVDKMTRRSNGTRRRNA